MAQGFGTLEQRILDAVAIADCAQAFRYVNILVTATPTEYKELQDFWLQLCPKHRVEYLIRLLTGAASGMFGTIVNVH